MRNPMRKTVILVLGVLTASILTVSQLFQYQKEDFRQEEVKTEKQSEESVPDQSAAFIEAATVSVLNSVHTQINQEVVFLFEILFQEDKQYPWIPAVPLALGKYFQTLFHIIISPNAP
jgi:hypothetical protein